MGGGGGLSVTISSPRSLVESMEQDPPPHPLPPPARHALMNVNHLIIFHCMGTDFRQKNKKDGEKKKRKKKEPLKKGGSFFSSEGGQ